LFLGQRPLLRASKQKTAAGSCPSSTPNAPGGADPWGGCWPNSANTGVPAGTTLKRVPADVTSAAQAGGLNAGWSYSGGVIQVTQANAVIDKIDLQSHIEGGSDFSGTKISNSRIRCSDITTAAADFCGSIWNGTIIDTEIGGGANGTTFINSQGFWVGGSAAGSSKITRAYVHHIVHGFHIDGGTTVSDTYIGTMPAGDSFAGDPSGSAHTDGVFVSTGRFMTFTHDSFDQAANNSEIFLQDLNGDSGIGDVTFQKNLFLSTQRNGQASSFGIGFENQNTRCGSNIHVLQNVFSKNNWDIHPMEVPYETLATTGCTTGQDGKAEVSGNTYTDNTDADSHTDTAPTRVGGVRYYY
jgi:hypothetical protein